MQILDMAALQRLWLGQRQAVLAHNIANANTVGYVAERVVPFERVLAQASDRAPHQGEPEHFDLAAVTQSTAESETEARMTAHSGTSVDVERELMDAVEVRSAYALNVSVVKTLYRMMQTGVRS